MPASAGHDRELAMPQTSAEKIMPVYTVHEPPLRAGQTAADPERFVFVRDGFYFWGFLLGPLWMLWRRLWLVLILFIVVTSVIDVGLQLAGAAVGLQVGIAVLIALLVGFEAGTLRRWTLMRRGWRTVGTVVGDDMEAAEHRFFASWVEHQPLRTQGMPASQAVPTVSAIMAARPPRVPRPTSSACFPSPEPGSERGDCRLRLGQSALGGQGFRAGGARIKERAACPRHQRS
jgi:hypothetical protein